MQLGFEVAPIEANVRTQTGRYLDGWYKRLRDAYVTTMAGLGVITDLSGQEFMDAMARFQQVDPGTPGGSDQGDGQRGHRQAAPAQPGPGAVLRAVAGARAGKAASGHPGRRARQPADRSAPQADEDRRGGRPVPGCDRHAAVVYPSPGPSPLDVLPHTPEGKPLPGGFRLGISPGMVKHQGTQTVLWRKSNSRSTAACSTSPT
ncbi:hypothetical protein ACFZA1_42210 [Streptomyces filipinensis]|uniref:hypothetical protein n=1 Tax=Streptomyces filipinensis TaxID=66887 RepID=UPI0036EA8B50